MKEKVEGEEKEEEEEMGEEVEEEVEVVDKRKWRKKRNKGRKKRKGRRWGEKQGLYKRRLNEVESRGRSEWRISFSKSKWSCRCYVDVGNKTLLSCVVGERGKSSDSTAPLKRLYHAPLVPLPL